MNSIKNIYNFTMTLCGALILNAIIIALVLGVPAVYLLSFIPCGE